MFKVLDTTIRDGSYANHFRFTTNDVTKICEDLETAGIEFIEVGHGVGLGASEKGYGRALHTDREYMKAARSAIKNSKYGMFCIPGIAEIDMLDDTFENKMDFIRIGTDVSKIETSKEFIKKSKKNGLFVTSNFMKSYVLTPKEFAQKVLISEDYGTDLVYLVDSAGGMFPDDLKRYYEEIRRVSDIPLGFHAHNNLGMAVANSLTAIDLGFDLVDSSLQGMGRSSGNASTELLISALVKMNKYKIEYDYLKLIEIGAEYVRRFIDVYGIRALDIISGYSDFHTSYMKYIHKVTEKYNVDPLKLIIEYTKHDKINMDEKALEEIAMRMSPSGKNIEIYDFESYYGGEQDDK